MIALGILPAVGSKPKGKYVDMETIRRAANKIKNVDIEDVLKFVLDSNIEKKMGRGELISYIVTYYSKKETA